MSEEMIEPCPFCGEGACVFQDTGEYYAECTECENRTSLKDTKGAAIAAWNTRAYNPNERLSQEVEELKHDVERQMSIANAECNRAERLREALERAAENFERLQVPHLVGNDVHNFAYQAAKAARSALSPLPQGEDRG